MTSARAACQAWVHGFPVPGGCEATAARAERLGFDGLLLADSQNLVGDVFVELGVATSSTIGNIRLPRAAQATKIK